MHCFVAIAATHLAAVESSVRQKGHALGFTLAEVLVATALLGLLAGGAIWTLVQANNYASITRLYTGAQTVAQNRIDQILSDGPFNSHNNEFPAVIKIPLDDL